MKGGTEQVENSTFEIYRVLKEMFCLFFKGLSIAGETTSFVNTILENYKNGIPDGGLKDLWYEAGAGGGVEGEVGDEGSSEVEPSDAKPGHRTRIASKQSHKKTD